jgi:VanZ family protein
MKWLMAAAWMAVIFTFSTDAFSAAHTTPIIGPLLSTLFPNLSPSHVINIAMLVRKLGHLSEFFILAVLLMRAFSNQAGAGSEKRRALYTVGIATLYAISDEWHQSFVPSRTSSAQDVLIDAIGAICGACLCHWWRQRGNKQKRN